jgi:glycerophosphoryl diester phosphodiesterase
MSSDIEAVRRGSPTTRCPGSRQGSGVLVLSHDPDLAGKTVAETLWSELCDADLGGGARPTTLEAVLARFPEGAFDLEVKNDPAEPGFDPTRGAAVEVARLARHQDIVTSFDWESVDRVLSDVPGTSTGLLLDHPAAVLDAVAHARALGHRAVLPRWTMIEETGVRAAHEAGLRILTWTVDDPAVARELVATGVDGIITNDPESMIEQFTGGVG